MEGKGAKGKDSIINMLEEGEEFGLDEDENILHVPSSEQESNPLSKKSIMSLPFVPSTNVSTENRLDQAVIGIDEGEMSDGVNCPSSEEEEEEEPEMQKENYEKTRTETIPLESKSIADMIRQSLVEQAEVGIAEDPAVIQNPQQVVPEKGVEKEKDKNKSKKKRSKKETKKKEPTENSVPVMAKVVTREEPSNIPLRVATPINLVVPPASVIPSVIAKPTATADTTTNTTTSPSLPLRPSPPSSSIDMNETPIAALPEQAVVPSLSTDQAIGVALSLSQMIPSAVHPKSGSRSAGLDENAFLSAQSISVLSNVVSTFEIDINLILCISIISIISIAITLI